MISPCDKNKFANSVAGFETWVQFYKLQRTLQIKFGHEKYQETMYCQEDNECSEVNVCHFFLNTRTSNAVWKGRGITGKFYRDKVLNIFIIWRRV